MVIVALASKGQLFNQVVSASVVGPEVGDGVGAEVAQACFTFAITDTSVDHESTSVGHP